jgi:IPT/TIG domain
MTLFKRHIGRRVAGVGLAAALVVLLVEAPAFAVTPTVTGFSPTSGPTPGSVGSCIVDVTGSNFTNPAVTGVAFDNGTGTPVPTTFHVISDTVLWTDVPAGAGNGPISVTNASGTASSSGSFVVANPGGCAPTAASFTPHCGPAGTEVTITGTNLLSDSGNDPTSDPPVGGHVRFDPYAANAAEISATPTELHVTVPGGGNAIDTQPIRIDTFNQTVGEGRVFTDTQFAVGTCVTNMSPSSGPVGTLVTLTGVGFDNVTQVTFTNNVIAGFTHTSNTSSVDTITTNVPFGAATGPITLFTADAPDGVSVQTATFTVTTPPPPPTHHFEERVSGAEEAPGRSREGQRDRRVRVHRLLRGSSGEDPAQGLRDLEDHRDGHHRLPRGLQEADPR